MSKAKGTPQFLHRNKENQILFYLQKKVTHNRKSDFAATKMNIKVKFILQ